MPTDPARVQATFLAAADLADPAERAACLDRECAGDAALRSRVEALLRAVDQPDSLLDVPIAPAAGGETKTQPSDPSATQTHGDGSADDVADALAFLAPPGRPDSLGRLGHYEVLEVLGRGGFGIVYRAFDDVLQRVVAVKVLAPSMAVTSPARKRFLREAQSAAKIQHENVVRIIEIGEQPLPYLVMEFIPGETLQQRLDRTGPLEVPEVLRIGRQIAAGLAAAHATGLIHRDIKPSNILIGGPGELVKITDFGLARAADDASLTRSGTVAGTPMFMAPEQAKGETLDHRADLFSLGSVLYTMLTGRPPFRASGTLAVLKRVAEDDPRPIREVIPEVPDWFCRIVDKLHAKDPAERYQSAREVADVLTDCEAQLAAHGGLKDYSRIPGGRPTRRRLDRRWVWAGAAGLVGIALLLFAVAIGRPAWLYLSNQGELNLEPQDGLVSIIVLQNDEGVFDDNKLHPLVTDWLPMKTGHTLKLPPGKYQLNAGLAPPGPNIVHWEVTTSGTFGSRRRLVPGLGHVGWSVIVTVGRGERVSVRPVPAQTSPAPPSPTGDKGAVSRELPSTAPADKPFFVVEDGRPDNSFGTLAQALSAAPAGAVVEVRGNGPFVTAGAEAPRAVTIRAGTGFRPVLVHDPADGLSTALIAATRGLTLEGLELRNQGGPSSQRRILVNVAAGSFAAANCRFVSAGALTRAVAAPRVDLRNCEFLSAWIQAAAVNWTDPPSKGVLRMANCVSPNWGLFLNPSQKELEDVRLDFRSNTLTGAYLMSLYSDGELLGDGKRPPPFRVTAAGNVLQVPSLFRVEINSNRTAAANWPLERVDHLARAALHWTGERNVYLPTTGYELWHGDDAGKMARAVKSRAAWKEGWGASDTGGLEEAVRFFGPTRRDGPTGVAEINPDNFRLAVGSPGLSAGSGGNDLGADVTLVGPGDAYERWKKTPDHRDWAEARRAGDK
jgi:serine/threonine protein kinase